MAYSILVQLLYFYCEYDTKNSAESLKTFLGRACDILVLCLKLAINTLALNSRNLVC